MGIGNVLLSFSINKKIIYLVAAPSIGLMASLSAQANPEEYQIMVNYNGQADLLLSLQIPTDYYPYQFKGKKPYDHLTNTGKYIVTNEYVSTNKQEIGKSLQGKIDSLMSKIKEFGPSLWDKELYKTGVVYQNNQFWNNKKTNLLFLEQYISDDYVDIRNSYDTLPSHKKLIITNHRAARDPYTIFSKQVFDCFKSSENCSTTDDLDHRIYNKFKQYMDTYEYENSNSIYRFGKFIDFWNSLMKGNNEQLSKLKFEEIIEKSKKNLFSLNQDEDKILAQEYLNVVFTHEEICVLNNWAKEKGEINKCHEDHDHYHSHGTWNMNYLSNKHKPKKIHHPSLENHLIPGSAPLSEGSQKDIIVFLYQFAAAVSSYASDPSFEAYFHNDYRRDAMKNALNNAYQISKNIHERIDKIRIYFKKIGVVDSNFDPSSNNYTTTNSKTFTVLSFSPKTFGSGEATIQSMSKFPWIYQDIGLKQPIPKNLQNNHKEIFSVDDGGWWWKVGSASLDPKHLLKFKETTDTLLILADPDDWNLIQDKTSGTLIAAASLLKTPPQKIEVGKIQGRETYLINNQNYPISYGRYHLWNEGLSSPISLNLLLDNLVDIFQRQYDSTMSPDNKQDYQKAMDWGEYWHDHFIKGTNSTSTPE